MDIPDFHEAQHGTAVVLLAALINALKITGKRMEDLKVVVNGIGAGGIACGKMLITAGVTNIIGCDRQGIIYRGADYGGNTAQEAFAEITNPDNIQGDLQRCFGRCRRVPGPLRPQRVDSQDGYHHERRPNRVRNGKPSTGDRACSG